MGDKLLQAAFTGGELAPSLHSRVDLQTYLTGCATLQNFMIHTHGGASNRPGFQFCGEVKDSSKSVRLIPFVYNTSDAYVLEFGDLYMRVWRNAGQVLYPSGHAQEGQPVEIVTPYAEADLLDIGYQQSADVMVLTHPSHPVYTLSRTDHHVWSIVAATFGNLGAAPTGLAVTPINFGDNNAGVYYKVSAVFEDGSETAVSAHALTTVDVNWQTGEFVNVTWNALTNAKYYKVYKNEYGIYGLVAEVTGLEWQDRNTIPDTSQGPLEQVTVFDGAGKYPAISAFYQQRLLAASTDDEPITVSASMVGDFWSFNKHFPRVADDGFSITMDVDQVNRIRHLVPMRDLVVMTSGGVHTMSSGGEAFSPENIKFTPQSFYGASKLRPLRIGETALYEQEKTSSVRDLGYSFEMDGFVGNDLSVMASHLFESHNLVDWAHAAAPHGIVWAVRDDGVLLGMTYLREHKIWGWHRHVTSGSFESICSIPENDEDTVYTVVKRTINGQTKRYVERLHTRRFAEVDDAFFVDSGLSYDGAATTTLTGLSHLEGESVSVLADGNVYQGLTVSSGQVTLPEAASKAHVGLPYIADIETLEPPLQGTVGRKKTVGKLIVRVLNSRGFAAGPDFDHLSDQPWRSDEPWGEPTRLYTGDQELTLAPTWQQHGKLAIRQSYPVPLTILSVIPEVTVGG